ncbi:MAG: rhodanese-like domain-containing protein [Pseudomonadota bacterium]
MEEINQFLSNNILLIIMWFVLLFMIVNGFVKGAWDRTPQEVVRLMNNENSLLLDVRENNEYQEGHIVDSLHIPMSDVKKRIKELDKFKDSPVIVGCRSGHRSSRACALLKKNGFNNVFNLRGGIMAWENEKLPITKS